MAGGRGHSLSEIPFEARSILDEARRGFLGTTGTRGRAHVVPVCYVVRGDEIVTPIDAKPKSGKPLGRRRNLERSPEATFVVDRWSEDWTRLGWVMARGGTRFEATGDVDDLVARYPQYEDVFVGSDLIVLHPDEVSWWLWTNPGGA